MAMKIEASKDGKQLIITCDVDKSMPLSQSGKTHLVFTTRGAVESEVKVDGKPLMANINLYTYAEGRKKGGKP